MARRKGLITYSKRAAEELARVRGRGRTKTILRLLALLVLIVIVLVDRTEVLGPRSDDHAAFDKQTVTINRVIDGDGVEISTADHPAVTVRLLGIDAPEYNAVFGPEATAALRSKVEGRQLVVTLKPDETRDKYQRLLAYLHEPDGTIINQHLVEEGYAYAHRNFRHPYEGMFISAEAAARKEQRGLWAVVKETDQPQWRQKWLAERARERRELEGYRD